MKLPKQITVREVATRDGFQTWPDFIPTDQKLTIIEAATAAGIKNFETTAFVSPKAVPQMSDGAELMRRVPKDNITHGVLVPNFKGAQLAVSAEVDQLNVVISASEAHNKANFNRSIDESINDLKPIFNLAREKNVEIIGAVAVAFGCPFSGTVPIENVIRVIQTYVSLGSHIIAIADTTGMATPLHVERLIGAIRDRFPGTEVLLHLHNNRGSAMANLYAGLLAGATIFDTSLGGIGGCPNVPQASGNLATEDVVCMLENMGIETGIDLEQLIAASRLLESILGSELPGQVLKSGPILWHD